MSRQFLRVPDGEAIALEVPEQPEPPHPILVRAQSIPGRHHFPEHAHAWNQMVYAISGVLTVAVEGRCFVISPQQAVWLPTGTSHRVGSLLGAEFRSLYVADDSHLGLGQECYVFTVSHLLRSLVIEAAALENREEDPTYAGLVMALILEQLRRSIPVPFALPWPREEKLAHLCEALYAEPSNPRSVGDWATELGMSERTLARRFERETGTTLRDWRRRLRLFKALELLGGGASVTQTALDLGYASASAFIFMFRSELGCTPHEYVKGASWTDA